MNEELARVLIVGAVLGTAAVAALWWRRQAARHGDPVNVDSLAAPQTAIVFTRDECKNCEAVLALVDALALPVRRVRIEDEQEVFDRLGVSGVPLTVITDGSGRNCAQIGGLPSARALRRAARCAREMPGGPGEGI